MKKMLALVFAMVLLASFVPLAVTPAAAYEKKIPGDTDGNDELTKEELVSAILPYMLEEGAYTSDDVGDAAYVYAYWSGEPRTVVDNIEREVAFYRPVERIVSSFPALTRVIVETGGVDKLVGVSDYMTEGRYAANLLVRRAYPELKELPGVGSYREPNMEQIVLLKPDVVISSTSPSQTDVIQTNTGIPTVGLSTSYPYEGGAFEGYRLAGRVMGNEEGAEELISFVNEEFDKVRAMVSEIPEDERVRVYFCSGITSPHITEYGPIEIAGGINVAAGSGFGWGTPTTKEQVIKWNPDIILIHSTGKSHTSGSIEGILSDPDLQSISAVKNGTVYYSKGGYIGRNPATGVTEVPYMAKLCYPDKFKDLDVEAEGNRILERFYGVDGLYTWMQENCDLYKWE